jgi:hypothetical protein
VDHRHERRNDGKGHHEEQRDASHPESTS